METALYLPIKNFLEAAGYAVKGEIGSCDVVGLSGDEPTVVVICELKLTFNLELVLQAVDRATASDEVWIAARVSAKGKGERAIAVFAISAAVSASACWPFPTAAQLMSSSVRSRRCRGKNIRRRLRLVEEHRRRKGDPALGGSTRAPIMTAYRQQALACAVAIQNGQQRPKDIRANAPEAAKILRHNVYGWFERVDRGIYALTELGSGSAEALAAGGWRLNNKREEIRATQH